jgi:hypothetical protein
MELRENVELTSELPHPSNPAAYHHLVISDEAAPSNFASQNFQLGRKRKTPFCKGESQTWLYTPAMPTLGRLKNDPNFRLVLGSM